MQRFKAYIPAILFGLILLLPLPIFIFAIFPIAGTIDSQTVQDLFLLTFAITIGLLIIATILNSMFKIIYRNKFKTHNIILDILVSWNLSSILYWFFSIFYALSVTKNI